MNNLESGNLDLKVSVLDCYIELCIYMKQQLVLKIDSVRRLLALVLEYEVVTYLRPCRQNKLSN